MSEIILYVGSAHRLVLGGLGSAGYTWNYVIDGAEDMLSVQFETSAPSSTPQPSSYSVDYIYTITALKPGKARIRFYLHRPWERDTPPLQETIIDVMVSQP